MNRAYDRLRIVYLAHTIRSDWNNGNAHFLRGLTRALGKLGHIVTVLEPDNDWSIENLREERAGARSLVDFAKTYSDLDVRTYPAGIFAEAAESWMERLREAHIVILHEWNPPSLAQFLLTIREALGFRLLFHDTHHRASSSPDQIEAFGLSRFDGILAFGESLRTIYRRRFGMERVWTLHEAADTSVFQPVPEVAQTADAVWIGNWGEEERVAEIRSFYLEPARALADQASFFLYGVRYPQHAQDALRQAHVRYAGYLPNLSAPCVYAGARLTVHIPRQQYNSALTGIPTIRVFEALACGIPLISAPWEDVEQLFDAGDFTKVDDTAGMIDAMRFLLNNAAAAQQQAARGLKTVLARHTCRHRALELTRICHEVIA
jgi:spore maturation protein CgeB